MAGKWWRSTSLGRRGTRKQVLYEGSGEKGAGSGIVMIPVVVVDEEEKNKKLKSFYIAMTPNEVWREEKWTYQR